MANIDAANGDTLYTLQAAQAPFVLQAGNRADGASLWVANLDPAAVITVEASGAHAGTARWNLSARGDNIIVPAGDVTIVTITASAYPANIGWAYLDPAEAIRTGVVLAQGAGVSGTPAGGVTSIQGANATSPLPVPVLIGGQRTAVSGVLSTIAELSTRWDTGLGMLTGSGMMGVVAIGAGVKDGSAAATEYYRIPSRFVIVSALAIVAGTPQAIWTPAAGKKFRLMGYDLSSSVAAALIFKDAANAIYRTGVHGANQGVDSPPGMRNGILSAAANNTLNLDVSVNATVDGTVFGTEE